VKEREIVLRKSCEGGFEENKKTRREKDHHGLRSSQVWHTEGGRSSISGESRLSELGKYKSEEDIFRWLAGFGTGGGTAIQKGEEER